MTKASRRRVTELLFVALGSAPASTVAADVAIDGASLLKPGATPRRR